MTKNNKDGKGKDKFVLRTKEDFTFLRSLKIKSHESLSKVDRDCNGNSKNTPLYISLPSCAIRT